MSVTVYTTDGKRLAVVAPYHPRFPERARSLGGKWLAEKKLWIFDPRDEARVRDLLRQVYGTDGSPTETVDVQIRLEGSFGPNVWLFGRCVASRPGRDWQVRLGDGVIVIDGSFPGSGGSRNNPTLGWSLDVVLEIRDVPVTLLGGDLPGGVSLVSTSGVPPAFERAFEEE